MAVLHVPCRQRDRITLGLLADGCNVRRCDANPGGGAVFSATSPCYSPEIQPVAHGLEGGRNDGTPYSYCLRASEPGAGLRARLSPGRAGRGEGPEEGGRQDRRGEGRRREGRRHDHSAVEG